MKLEAKDRLILAMQYRILEKVSGDGENYAQYYEALENGYTYNYASEDAGFISVDEEHSTEECQEVWDILQMFDHLQIVMNRLNGPGGSTFKFTGFDGNHDWQYFYQVYIVETLGRFEQILPKPLNSHGTVLPHYRLLLKAWKALTDKYEYKLDKITKADLIELEQTVSANRATLG